MSEIGRYLLSRNPVWGVPLALPVVFFAGQSVERAILFGSLVVGVLIVTQTLSYFAESMLPRMLRIIPALIIAGGIVTIAEVVLYRMGISPGHRMLLMMRGVSVSGIVMWPTLRARRGERFMDRMQVVFGLVLGFVGGFAIFTAIRVALSSSGVGIADSVAFGFFLLALGRIVIEGGSRRA